MHDLSVTLYIFSGLPGAGKTTLAKMLAASLGAMHIRIDTIEQSLRDLCSCNVQGEGYQLAHAIAKDNLSLGLSVVADSVNPWQLTRDQWHALAHESGAYAIDVEVACSDSVEHRNRVESRVSDIANHILPTWLDVQNREYQEWQSSRIFVDTAGRSVQDSYCDLVKAIYDLQDAQQVAQPDA